MTDQVSLPVTFPPGTELPVKGKVEVTNEVHVLVMNAEVPVHITNALLAVELNNNTVKLGAGSSVEVSKGKIEVTNTVKVEGLATSPVAVKNGAGAEEASVNHKKLLVTQGFLRGTIKTKGETTKYLIKVPVLANAILVMESIFASWKEIKIKEKEKIYLKIQIEDVLIEGGPFFTSTLNFFLGEIVGAGEKTMTFEISLLAENAVQNIVINENNIWAALCLPRITAGIGSELNIRLFLNKASPVGTNIATEEKQALSVYTANEGTL